MRQRHLLIVVAAGATGLIATLAHGQSGPRLITQPFRPAESIVEVDFSTLYFGETDYETRPGDVGLTWYEAQGRANLGSVHERGAAVGFSLDYLDFDADPKTTLIPDQLTRQAFGAGAWLGDWQDWEIGVVAGAGYAGDEPYSDGSAWFPHASLIGRYHVDKQSKWIFTVNYDESRTIFPDIPLGGIAYQHVQSKSFVWTLGLPFSSVFWRPTQQLMIDARYIAPLDGEVTVTFILLREVRLFGGYSGEMLAFHRESQRKDDRTFFSQRRLEGGVRVVPCDSMELVIAGGLAFDQEFARGFDARELNDKIELENEPYIRAGFNVKF